MTSPGHFEIHGAQPIVTLPPDHWIIHAWNDYVASDEFKRCACWPLEPDATRIRQFMWEAFSAGAQSIPGNPEKIAELERRLAEVQIDGRVHALEMAEEDIDRRIANLESYCNDLQSKVEQLQRMYARHESRITDLDGRHTSLVESIGNTNRYFDERVKTLETRPQFDPRLLDPSAR